MEYQAQLIRDIAEQASKEVCRKAIRALQKQGRDSMQSGHDSGLKNLWDEICVQVQGNESVFWSLYEELIQRYLEEYMQPLPPAIKQVIWLQTDAGIDWSIDMELEEPPNLPLSLSESVVDDDILDYLQDFILSEAANWKNVRINKFLESGMEIG